MKNNQRKSEFAKSVMQTRFEEEKKDLSEKELLLETIYWLRINTKVNERKIGKIAVIEGILVFYLIVSIIGVILFLADL